MGSLRGRKEAVDIPELLSPLGFGIQFYGDGSVSLIHPALKIEFLVPEVGRGVEGPLRLPGFAITAQPLRFLDLLEEEVLEVPYRGMKVKVPHPARFAVHKLIVSQRRRSRTGKHMRDARQAIEVMNMLVVMGEETKLTGIMNGLTKKQKGYVIKSLQKVSPEEGMEFPALESIFKRYEVSR